MDFWQFQLPIWHNIIQEFGNTVQNNVNPTSESSLPLIFCIHVRSGPIYGRVIYLAKKIIRWWYFTCKKTQNIMCDGVLHVNMFPYFNIPCFTCTFFTKFTYNEYIGPYSLPHVVLRFSPVDSPRTPRNIIMNMYNVMYILDCNIT